MVPARLLVGEVRQCQQTLQSDLQHAILEDSRGYNVWRDL